MQCNQRLAHSFPSHGGGTLRKAKPRRNSATGKRANHTRKKLNAASPCLSTRVRARVPILSGKEKVRRCSAITIDPGPKSTASPKESSTLPYSCSAAYGGSTNTKSNGGSLA